LAGLDAGEKQPRECANRRWRGRATSGGITATGKAKPFSAAIRCTACRRSHFCGGGTMFVSDILAQKGGQVYSVAPTVSVAEVAQELSPRRIGSVLVLGERSQVIGIVSDAILFAPPRPTAPRPWNSRCGRS